MNTDGQTAVKANQALDATVKVTIVEDERKFRDAITLLIDGTEGFRCSGSYRSTEEALDKIAHDLPDVVLMDIGLPGMSGIEGTRRLKERFPQMVLLVHTVYEDDERIFDGPMRGRQRLFAKKDAACSSARSFAGSGQRRRADDPGSRHSRHQDVPRASSA
jgi:DNA-binding NarL/FixJ family response regulator